MPTNPVPEDADPLFREVMESIRTGKNPEHKRLQKLSAKQQKAVKQAAQKAQKKRKGAHRGGDDGVIDTGMFD
jgi:hypothetical protein